jgi:hypothetical protein
MKRPLIRFEGGRDFFSAQAESRVDLRTEGVAVYILAEQGTDEALDLVVHRSRQFCGQGRCLRRARFIHQLYRLRRG